MMGISKRSSKALVFLIDTTKSMSDVIAAVKNASPLIINSEVGTENEPSVYILVPFNDPGMKFGENFLHLLMERFLSNKQASSWYLLANCETFLKEIKVTLYNTGHNFFSSY